MNFYYAKLKKVNNGIMVFNSKEGGRELIKKENYHPSKLEKMIAIHWN